MHYIKEFYQFLKHLVASRVLLATLVINDFKKNYLGSYFGVVWAFVQPMSFIVVIWLVFTYGFRSSPHGNVPYFLWLATGMIPWFFLSDSLSSASLAIVNNSFLVKKVSFRVSVLPLVPIGSTFIIHLGLVLFLIVVFFAYGFEPTVYLLQLPYLMLCIIFLTLGISWITSALYVFIKDISHIITLLLQIGFWATPIFWDMKMIPDKYQWLIKLNPAYYIIQGYRDSFINHHWFWEMKHVTIYYLIITTFFCIFGAIIFKRLRPHFGDVL